MTDQKAQVYAIVRIDDIGGVVDKSNATLRVTVKEVLPTEAEAVQEVERLNALNGDKGAFYFWQATRLYAGGRPGVHVNDARTSVTG